MFRSRWLYYMAIALDGVLRFAWTLTLISPDSTPLGPSLTLYLTPGLGVAELLRRTAW